MSNHIQQAKGFLRTAEKYDAEHTAAIEKAGEKYEQSMRSAGASLFQAIVEEAAELGLGAPPASYALYVKWRKRQGQVLTGYAAGLREQGISSDTAARALVWHMDIEMARAERAKNHAQRAVGHAKAAAKLLAAREKATPPAAVSQTLREVAPARTGAAVPDSLKAERIVAAAERADSETTIFDPSLTDTQARAITLLRAMGEWVRANDDADVAAAMLLWQQSVVG